MLITVTSSQGGVDRTTAAVHKAAYLQTLAPTLPVHGDDNSIATAWAECGQSFPFKVAEDTQAACYTRAFTPTGIDAGQGPAQVELQALPGGCALLMIPAAPTSLDIDGLVLTLQALQDIADERYRRQRRRGRTLA